MEKTKKQKSKINLWLIASGILLGLIIFSFLFEIEVQPKRNLPILGKLFKEGERENLGISSGNLTPEEEETVQAFLKFKKIKNESIPTGVPAVYGQELGVDFDQVQESMNKMRVFGPTYGEEDKKIVLEGDELERFIKVADQTACEYCCGVDSLVKEDGSAACGCAHSIVMRGLVAYLIKNHSDQFSDEAILAEINNWKKVFFPKQTLAVKFDELKEAGDQDIETLLQEFPDFLPQMVGGC